MKIKYFGEFLRRQSALLNNGGRHAEQTDGLSVSGYVDDGCLADFYLGRPSLSPSRNMNFDGEYLPLSARFGVASGFFH